MQMRSPDSLPIGSYHYATLLQKVQDLEARLAKLENTDPAYFQLTELGAAPATPPANTGRIYVVDNGAGKSSLRVVFPTGAAQVLATEP